jgi:BMFP domain-containing protein YqiC
VVKYRLTVNPPKWPQRRQPLSLVSQEKFNELVASTTHYLESLIQRVKTLEEQVAELQPKTKTTRKAADNES